MAPLLEVPASRPPLAKGDSILTKLEGLPLTREEIQEWYRKTAITGNSCSRFPSRQLATSISPA
jgi:hypothetical protein